MENVYTLSWGEALDEEAERPRKGLPGRPVIDDRRYGKQQRFELLVGQGQKAALMRASEEQGRTVSDLIREAIDEWLRAHGYEGSEPDAGNP